MDVTGTISVCTISTGVCETVKRKETKRFRIGSAQKAKDLGES